MEKMTYDEWIGYYFDYDEDMIVLHYYDEDVKEQYQLYLNDL